MGCIPGGARRGPVARARWRPRSSARWWPGRWRGPRGAADGWPRSWRGWGPPACRRARCSGFCDGRGWRARYGRTRHVAASRPGDLVCLDTFYVGQLTGVGKVWQVTAGDAACSFGVAPLIPALSAAAAAAFLREILVPLYQRAGRRLTRVLTDGGSESKAEFDQACGELSIRHTRTKPRHAWTNGSVERLQQTTLAEHWRIQFRRRYFTRLRQLETSLQGFLRFYNGDRPHQGYRLRGRTPASVFWGAVPPEE